MLGYVMLNHELFRTLNNNREGRNRLLPSFKKINRCVVAVLNLGFEIFLIITRTIVLSLNSISGPHFPVSLAR